MLADGIWPACTTPFLEDNSVDYPSLARLLAWFEASGCAGAVLAGTNGEGPSLSAVVKRDLLREAQRMKGRLQLVLGIATSSLDEAQWQAKQAAKDEADALLLMAPAYFRRASEEGLLAWFRVVMEASDLPVIIYQNPGMTGITLSDDLLQRCAEHPRFAGIKDSSGLAENLPRYRQLVGSEPWMVVGDERLLYGVLEHGWNGTISACANVIPQWLAEVHRSRSRTKFDLILPVIEKLRACPQPETNKAIQHQLGHITRPNPLPPLLPADPTEALAMMNERLGKIV